LNVVKSRKINQINKNSTIKIAANFVEELNQRNENSDTKKKGRHTAYRSKIRRVLKEQNEKAK